MAPDALIQARQVAPTLDGIRADHVLRYRFAAGLAKAPVLDACCGIGYGAHVMGEAGLKVFAVDKSGDAIRFALKHYVHERVALVLADIADAPDLIGAVATVVAFECIEHVRDAPGMVAALVGMLGEGGTFIGSVPNEDVIPFEPKRYERDDSPHFRHYTPDQFDTLLREAGLTHIERFTQHGKRDPVVPGDNGRTLVYVGTR